jgi:hypothetical protein
MLEVRTEGLNRIEKAEPYSVCFGLYPGKTRMSITQKRGAKLRALSCEWVPLRTAPQMKWVISIAQLCSNSDRMHIYLFWVLGKFYP